jgi:hypothetical protein
MLHTLKIHYWYVYNIIIILTFGTKTSAITHKTHSNHLVKRIIITVTRIIPWFLQLTGTYMMWSHIEWTVLRWSPSSGVDVMGTKTTCCIYIHRVCCPIPAQSVGGTVGKIRQSLVSWCPPAAYTGLQEHTLWAYTQCRAHHSSPKPLIVSETSDTNSVFKWLNAQEHFIAYMPQQTLIKYEIKQQYSALWSGIRG